MKLTIITINYNNAIGLQKTIQSVMAQTYKEFEYIIVDGASIDMDSPLPPKGGIDELCQILGINMANTPFRGMGGFVSEPDSGIYNAMNKGIRMAMGDYLLFINSGDVLHDEKVVEDILPLLDGTNEIISGSLLLKNNTRTLKLDPPMEVNLQQCIHAGLTHPNTFIKRTLFDRYGLYNENNKIISDWEWFLQVCGLHTIVYKPSNRLISIFIEDGISSQSQELLENETEDALNRLLPWHINLKRKIKVLWKRYCKHL